MALRVLLADESSTIKKVFQLALQDFAVDVRPVNLGIDVLAVARTFKPDIIFADILLQKLNGYDVASQVKADPDLNTLPVVLMWSGFMELDEDKFGASKADARLEKPFDVNQLRNLVNELVPKTKDNRLSQYLTFPKMPDFKDEAQKPEAPAKAEEEFSQVPLPKINNNREKFRVDVDPNDDSNDIPVTYKMPDEKISVDSLLGHEEEPEQFAVRAPSQTQSQTQQQSLPPKAPTPPKAQSLSKPQPQMPPPPPPDVAVDLRPEHTRTSVGNPLRETERPRQLSEKELEKIIREQSRDVIESVVWKVIPELAAQIIERELARLLKERDNSPS
jgi:two-component system cell cycle response regulator